MLRPVRSILRRDSENDLLHLPDDRVLQIKVIDPYLLRQLFSGDGNKSYTSSRNSLLLKEGMEEFDLQSLGRVWAGFIRLGIDYSLGYELIPIFKVIFPGSDAHGQRAA